MHCNLMNVGFVVSSGVCSWNQYLIIHTFIQIRNIMDWTTDKNKLTKTFTFNDFTEAFAFMVKVAIVAEKMNHHPTWTNTWNRVSFELSTHDAGNIVTEKDRKLAEAIDRLA